MQSKWFGETQKHVAAIFSLACKIEPAIIFIGEPQAWKPGPTTWPAE